MLILALPFKAVHRYPAARLPIARGETEQPAELCRLDRGNRLQHILMREFETGLRE